MNRRACVRTLVATTALGIAGCVMPGQPTPEECTDDCFAGSRQGFDGLEGELRVDLGAHQYYLVKYPSDRSSGFTHTVESEDGPIDVLMLTEASARPLLVEGKIPEEGVSYEERGSALDVEQATRTTELERGAGYVFVFDNTDALGEASPDGPAEVEWSFQQSER